MSQMDWTPLEPGSDLTVEWHTGEWAWDASGWELEFKCLGDELGGDKSCQSANSLFGYVPWLKDAEEEYMITVPDNMIIQNGVITVSSCAYVCWTMAGCFRFHFSTDRVCRTFIGLGTAVPVDEYEPNSRGQQCRQTPSVKISKHFRIFQNFEHLQKF